MAGLPAPVCVPSQWPLAPNIGQSRLSANDKGHNDRKLCTDLLEFILQLRKSSARRPFNEGCETSHVLKWGPLPSNVGRITQHAREGEGRKKGKFTLEFKIILRK